MTTSPQTSSSAPETRTVPGSPTARRGFIPRSSSSTPPPTRAPPRSRPGRVLVIGGAQTGCQIAEDLIEAGREVLLATGRVPRIPRRYRGRDTVEWLHRCGFFSQYEDALPDPSMRSLPQPQVSGVQGGKTVSYQALARQGVRLLGRLAEVDGYRARFAAGLRDHLRFADEMRARILATVDAFIEREAIEAPGPGIDPAEVPADYDSFPDAATTLDLAAEGITSVIWCTGVRGDYPWLPPAALRDGLPAHKDGIGEIPGLYYVGFHWLQRRNSGILLGLPEDAARIADAIRARSGSA